MAAIATQWTQRRRRLLIAFLLSSSVWYILAWSCVEACANSTIYLCRLKAIIVMELGRVIITIPRVLWAHSIINIIEYVINWSNCGKLECGRQRDAWWWQTATTTTTTTTALPCHQPRPSQPAQPRSRRSGLQQLPLNPITIPYLSRARVLALALTHVYSLGMQQQQSTANCAHLLHATSTSSSSSAAAAAVVDIISDWTGR